MREFFQVASTQAPARTSSAAGANAELARIDVQLELAAKKAALAGMQRAAQAGSPAVAVPAPPVTGGTVRIEKEGKIITLENPTAEQLAAVTSGTTSFAGQPDVSGWQLVALTGAVVWGVVMVVWLLLSHRRRMNGPAAAGSAQTDARMARIENAIESVAVEVEKISEGQRYASRMLAEGAAVPVSVADRGAGVLQNRGDM
jgi:hypothetical protein